MLRNKIILWALLWAAVLALIVTAIFIVVKKPKTVTVTHSEAAGIDIVRDDLTEDESIQVKKFADDMNQRFGLHYSSCTATDKTTGEVVLNVNFTEFGYYGVITHTVDDVWMAELQEEEYVQDAK